MASYGLEILDGAQNIVLSPDTFTVRMVDSAVLSLGRIAPGSRIRVDVSSDVKRGMFAAVVPLHQYSANLQIISTILGEQYAAVRYYNQNIYHLPSTPWVEVFDGYVEVCASPIPSHVIDARSYGYPLLYSGSTSADIAIYIMTKD